MDLHGIHNYSFIFTFERNWKERVFFYHMQNRWADSFIYVAIYIGILLYGQYFMKTRSGYDLRFCLCFGNCILATFSIAGGIRTLPELITAVTKYGWQYSICISTYFNGVTSFWISMFTISKLFELGDTIFIVFRKRPLILLHCYHHVTVLLYTWYSYTDHTASGRWFMVMNYIVH